MAADDEKLMDVFIGIQPKPDFLAEVDRMADEASKRLIQKFGSIRLPVPKIGAPGIINQAADNERVRLLKEQESLTRKIAETEERIAKAKSNRGNRNTPAAEQKATQALANAQKEMLKNEEALQSLYRQNPYLKNMADVNAIADQIMKHSEDRKRAEKEQRVLIQQTEQAQLKLNKLQGEGNIKFTQSMLDEARARAAAANALVATRQQSLDEADTPLKTKRRATLLGAAQEAAQQAEREAAEIEAKRAGSVGRRADQRAIAEKNVADALALQAAGAQRLQEIDARAIVTATELAKTRLLAVQAFEESERKVADAQAKLSSIQANVGPASAAKQKELNDATEDFNRLQKERADIGQRLIDVEKQLAITTFADLNAASPEKKAPKEKKSKQEVENQKQIVALQKQEETTRGSILEIDKKIEIARKILGSKDPNSTGAVNQAAKVAALEQQKTAALQQQVNIAQQIATIQSGGGAAGGGGGRRGAAGGAPGGGGGNPPNPANAFRNQFKADIEAETRRVTELEVALDRLYETGPKNPEITRQFQVLKAVIEDARRELGYLNKDIRTSDPASFPALSQRLQDVGENRQNLSGRVFGSGGNVGVTQEQAEIQANKELIQLLIRKNQIISEEDQIRYNLEKGLLQGIDFEDEKTLRTITADIAIAQKEFSRISKEADGSKESVDAVTNAFIKLNGAIDPLTSTTTGLRDFRREFRQEASKGRGSASTNTLSNNAYQLGQAFEDFAVGFQLNGITGGVRGAANNISFLINNLSQSETFVKKIAVGISSWNTALTKREAAKLAIEYSRQIPLIAAIGTAIGITILPPLIEWLESLNDIEVGFEDISGRIQRDFSNLKFKVELEADERNFLRTIDRAKELKEVFDQLGAIAEQSQDKKIDFQKLFGDPKNLKNQAEAINQLAEANRFAVEIIQDAISRGERNFQSAANAAAQGGPFDAPLTAPDRNGFITKELTKQPVQGVTEAASAIKNVRDGLKLVNEEASRGIFDTAKITAVVESFRKIEKVYASIKERGDLAKPELVDALKATIDATGSSIEDLEKTSKEIDSINVKLIEGVETARRKTRELAQEQVLIMNVIRGTMNEGVLDAFDVVGIFDEQLAMLEKTRQQVITQLNDRAKTTSGNMNATADPEAVAQANATAAELKEALRIETINKILLRRKEIEEQINDLQDKRNGNSELTTLDKISQDLIKSQLSVDDESKKAFKDLTEQLEILNANLRVINTNSETALGSAFRMSAPIPSLGGQVSATALGAAVDYGAMSFMMRDAVFAGVKEAMAGQQKPVVEVLEKVNSGVNRINTGAQN